MKVKNNMNFAYFAFVFLFDFFSFEAEDGKTDFFSKHLVYTEKRRNKLLTCFLVCLVKLNNLKK